MTSISHRMSASEPVLVNDALNSAASLMEHLKRVFTEEQYYPAAEHLFSLKVVKDVLGKLPKANARKEGELTFMVRRHRAMF